MEIFLNKKQWNNFSEEQVKDYVDSVFKHYKTLGFPYFPTDPVWRQKEFEKLYKFNHMSCLKEKDIEQSMHGLSLCWSYMPHAYSVRCNNFISPKEAFDNDDIFKKVILKRMKMGDNISDNGIRKMLKIYSGVQCVSNFRPTTASVIYDIFAKNGVVWDMSCGYGGRLLGAINAGVDTYIGTEPCKKTYDGLIQISKDFSKIKTEIYKIGSEDFVPQEKSLDLCFTSPPYFNTERYSDEETQSWKKFPDKNSWLNVFMKQTFKNCHYGLKENGIMAINIANVKSYQTLETDIVNLASKTGFELVDTMYYCLSSLSHKDKYKKEPVFIFKKST